MFLTIAPCMRETTLKGGSYIKAQAYLQKTDTFNLFHFIFFIFTLYHVLHMLLKSKTKLDAYGASWINKENSFYFVLLGLHEAHDEKTPLGKTVFVT